MRYRLWSAGFSAAALVAAGVAIAPVLASHSEGHRHAGVYAPYFETWTKDSISVIASRSGAKFFTLAFIQAAG